MEDRPAATFSTMGFATDCDAAKILSSREGSQSGRKDGRVRCGCHELGVLECGVDSVVLDTVSEESLVLGGAGRGRCAVAEKGKRGIEGGGELARVDDTWRRVAVSMAGKMGMAPGGGAGRVERKGGTKELSNEEKMGVAGAGASSTAFVDN
jgi:hypothetical protein